MTIQNAQPPYEIRCLDCGRTWTPPVSKHGINKGQVTPHTITSSVALHEEVCPGPPAPEQVWEGDAPGRGHQ